MRTLTLKCKAPAWFDPETQRYELCPGRIEATVEQAGRKLDCPVCDAPIDVPSATAFQDLAPRAEPDAPVPGLDDELQLAPATPVSHGVPSASPPRSAGKGPTGTIASAKAAASTASPAKETPARAPAKAVPSKAPEPATKARADERLSVGDLSGDDDEVKAAATPIRHTDEEHWLALAPDADPPPVNTRVKQLMDDDDADEYQVSAPVVSLPNPTSTTASRAHAPVYQGDSYDEYAAGAPAEASGERSSTQEADSTREAIDLGGFGAADVRSDEPADDWLSAPLPGVEPAHPGFATPPLASSVTSSGHLSDASRVLAPAKTEWIPRHRILAAQEVACPHCRSPLQRDVELCERCGYHLRLKRVVKNYQEPKEHVSGFDFYLKKHLNEHATVGGMKALLGVLAPIGAIFALVILWAVIGIFAFCLVVPLGMAAILLAAACLIPGPRGSDPFNPWWAILQFQRLSGWKLFHKSTIPLGVIERKTRDFDDAALDQMPELETTDVLDLQGSSVTDQGIAILRHYKNLKFLVVRDTQVTALGVKNLQYEFPELLIWR